MSVFLVCFRYPILKKFNPLALRDDKHEVSPLWYPNVIQQKGIENTKTYQVEVVILIEHQILVTDE